MLAHLWMVVVALAGRMVGWSAPEEQQEDEAVQQEERHSEAHCHQQGRRVAHVLTGVRQGHLGCAAVYTHWVDRVSVLSYDP